MYVEIKGTHTIYLSTLLCRCPLRVDFNCEFRMFAHSSRHNSSNHKILSNIVLCNLPRGHKQLNKSVLHTRPTTCMSCSSSRQE